MNDKSTIGPKDEIREEALRLLAEAYAALLPVLPRSTLLKEIKSLIKKAGAR